MCLASVAVQTTPAQGTSKAFLVPGLTAFNRDISSFGMDAGVSIDRGSLQIISWSSFLSRRD